MRCYICDCEDDSITFNRDEQKFSPCRTCQQVIYETVLSYDLEDDVLEDD